MVDSIKLTHNNREKVFTLAVALSVIRTQVKNNIKDGWTIHKDEPYEFIENEIIRKRSTRNSKAKKGKRSNRKGGELPK